MPLPPELQPRTKSRVIDLVARAGIDVSDWPNYEGGDTRPGANPKYCYEWALKEPEKVVVCNLWTANMKEVDGHFEQHLVLKDTPLHKEVDPTRRARRERMLNLLADAAQEQLPIRVIVLDSGARAPRVDGKTQVKYRALDPESWSVVRAESSSGTFILRRGVFPRQFRDQFDVHKPPEGAAANSTTTVTVRNRSREVRLFALSRAGGKCEFCGTKGFSFPDGSVYLETHHILSLASEGPDSIENVAALCANHHREAHFGKSAISINEYLRELRRNDA